MNNQIKAYFIFRSKTYSRMGGTEKSMLRLIQFIHPNLIQVKVIHFKIANIDFEEQLNQAGCLTIKVTSLFELYRLLKAEKPDIIYLFARLHMTLWGLVSKLARIPVIIGAVRGSSDKLLDRISQLLSRSIVDLYITNSLYAKSQLLKMNINQNKVYTIYNGLSTVQEKSNESPFTAFDEYPKIVCVANIRSGKGIIYLLRAAKILQKDYPNIKVYLLGADYSSGRIFKKASSEKLDDIYTWLGFTEKITDYLMFSDVFVLPSLHEGLPTSILEALSLGIPVVASNVSGISELVKSNETGILTTPKDVDDIACSIKLILSDIKLRSYVISNGKQLVENEFSIENMARKHNELFQSLLRSAIE